MTRKNEWITKCFQWMQRKKLTQLTNNTVVPGDDLRNMLRVWVPGQIRIIKKTKKLNSVNLLNRGFININFHINFRFITMFIFKNHIVVVVVVVFCVLFCLFFFFLNVKRFYLVFIKSLFSLNQLEVCLSSVLINDSSISGSEWENEILVLSANKMKRGVLEQRGRSLI